MKKKRRSQKSGTSGCFVEQVKKAGAPIAPWLPRLQAVKVVLQIMVAVASLAAAVHVKRDRPNPPPTFQISVEIRITSNAR